MTDLYNANLAQSMFEAPLFLVGDRKYGPHHDN